MSPDQKIEVERLNVAEGDAVVLDRVLLISDDGKVITGNPIIKGARVKATSLGEFRGDKVIVLCISPRFATAGKRDSGRFIPGW